MGEVCVTAVFIALIAMIAAVTFDFGRSSSTLRWWAAEAGYVIESSEALYFNGPFFWSSSRGQVVYLVTVRDAHGVRRTAWVRVGHFWLGQLSCNVEVRWKG